MFRWLYPAASLPAVPERGAIVKKAHFGRKALMLFDF
jgi:hypothetical protein